MKKKRSVRSFLAGMLTALVIAGMISPAVALTGKTIQAYTGINVYVNDQKIEPKDANGNPVDVFVYNGTTYLPIRAIGNALGIPVAYDAATTSAYLGKHESETPSVWLKDLDYFSGSSSIYKADREEANTGEVFNNCITRSFDRTYLINGQYSRLAGTIYQTYHDRSESGKFSLKIYGDDVLLYDYDFSGTGLHPVSFDVDLSGVLELRVIFKIDYYWAWEDSYFSLGNAGLYT